MIKLPTIRVTAASRFMALAVGLVIAGCGDVSTTALPSASIDTPAPSQASDQPADDEPQAGGVLLQWGRTDVPTFLPHGETQYDVHSAAGKVYNQIVTNNPQDFAEITPDLAKSWEISEDGLEYLFEFEEGVTFHDGTAFTSADAKFTIDSMMNPPEDVGSVFQAYLADTIAEVEAPADDTLRVVLRKPSEMFLKVLANQSMSVVSEAFVAENGWQALRDQPMGTGPFILTEIVRGERYFYERNPDYFKEGLPYLDGIEIIIIEDPTSVIGALATGQLHLMGTDVRTSQVELLGQSAPDVLTAKVRRQTGNTVFFNTLVPPFDDVRVRQAVTLALVQEDARSVVFEDYLAIGGPMPPGFWALPDEELQSRPEYGGMTRDERISLARQLLDEAGYPDGFELEWSERNEGLNATWAEYVASTLPDIGIAARYIPKDRAAATADFDSTAYDFFTRPWTYGIDDPTDIFANCCIPDGQYNIFDYNNPEFNRLWEEQQGIQDPEERREIVWQMQRILLDDLPKAFLGWWEDGYAYRPEVHGYQSSPSGGMSFHRLEQVWLGAESP